MKINKSILFLLPFFFVTSKIKAQNVSINILTQKSGIVKKGKTLFLEVQINNTDPTAYVGVFKLRTQISVPAFITTIESKGHILPTGWAISNNRDSTLTLTNGKDMIAANDVRTILIALKGSKVGGPLSIAGRLSFSDGLEPGIATGILQGDLPADNFSTTTCKVIK